MRYNPYIHHRHSIRLKGYDYSRAGVYFVTICTQNRRCLFGHVVDWEMVLNDAGRMVETVCGKMPAHYPGIDTDLFQIMPNHIHGIIIVGAGLRACPDDYQPGDKNGQPQGVAPTLSLSDVVHRFKTLTTKRYTDGVKQHGWPPFPGRLWQRNYFEHIVRNEDELNRIREYITNNPMKWELDRENPDMTGQPQGAAPTDIDEPWRI